MKNYFKYTLEHEIACGSDENALTLAKILMEEGYVVMLSKEEKLTIVNYLWSQRGADRNDVRFMTFEDFEEILFNEEEED